MNDTNQDKQFFGNILVWANWLILGPKMTHPHNWVYCKKIKIWHNKIGQQVDENNLNDFSQKMLVWGKWTILDPKMAHPHNSGLVLRAFLKFCTMNGANSAWQLC